MQRDIFFVGTALTPHTTSLVTSAKSKTKDTAEGLHLLLQSMRRLALTPTLTTCILILYQQSICWAPAALRRAAKGRFLAPLTVSSILDNGTVTAAARQDCPDFPLPSPLASPSRGMPRRFGPPSPLEAQNNNIPSNDCIGHKKQHHAAIFSSDLAALGASALGMIPICEKMKSGRGDLRSARTRKLIMRLWLLLKCRPFLQRPS